MGKLRFVYIYVRPYFQLQQLHTYYRDTLRHERTIVQVLAVKEVAVAGAAVIGVEEAPTHGDELFWAKSERRAPPTYIRYGVLMLYTTMEWTDVYHDDDDDE